MAKKKKLTKAERKEARLRKGKQWLLTYTGSPKKMNKHYRERFQVDAVTAAKDLQADIKPYITKKFMAVPCIKEQDIQAICQILLPRYKNVQLMQGLTNNKPDFRIQVKGLFGTEEKRFEVVGGDKKRSATKKKSDLGWIDRLEEIDAALDDF